MNYEINEGTLAILAKNKKSLILEDDKKYVVDSLPFDVVDHSCKYFGSSYEGRKEGTKEILHINYKVPIIVDNSRNLIFFPTNSPISDDCSWLSLKSIKSIKEGDFNTTDVIFNNGVSINIPVSKRTIDNQILRASRLDLIMRNRNA
jgi:comK protein